jgi:hypothetical protein
MVWDCLRYQYNFVSLQYDTGHTQNLEFETTEEECENGVEKDNA